MLTKSEGHCYVQTPALRDTVAEKHVTKILKCFTISAAPCTTSMFAQLFACWYIEILLSYRS
jgi:hypothetical protein